MASFVEQATLVVKDQSTAQINKINAALKQLRATANSLRSVRINLGVSDSQVKRATQSLRALKREVNSIKSARINIEAKTGSVRMAQAQVKKLSADVRKLKADAASMRAVKLTVNSQGLQSATQRLKQLQQAAAHPINVQMPRHGAAGGIRGAAAAGAARRGGGAATAGARGFISGTGVHGLAGLVGSFGAVTTAGYAAAAALRSVAENAGKRDRTNLQSAVAASEAQRKVFAERDKAIGGEGRKLGDLPITKDEFNQFRTSLLGDVPGQAEETRAENADKMARIVMSDILPRLFSQDPTRSREETLEGARNFVKTLNLASSELFDSSGNFSKDAARVLKGMQLAMAANPELKPEQMRTVAANLKASATGLGSESLAQVFIAAGDQGVRAANELYQAIQGLSGTKDVKHLNETLRERGFLTDFKRKKDDPTKAIQPGSGRIVDEKMLFENPQLWMLKHYKPQLDKELADEAKLRQNAAKKAGKSEEEIKQAGVINNADVQKQVNKDWAGMTATAKNAITQVMTGFQQASDTLKQAQTSLDQPIGEAIQKSWVTAAEAVKVAWIDAAAGFGEALIKAIGGGDLMNKLADTIRNHPEATIAATAVGALGTAAGAAAFSVAALGRIAGAAALAQGAGAAAGGAASAAGGAAAAAGTGLMARAATATTIAAAVVALLSLKGDAQSAGTYADASPEERARMAALAHAYDQLFNSTQRLKDIQDQRAAPEGAGGKFDKFQPIYVDQFNSEVNALTAKIASINAEIARLKEPGAEAQKPPDWVSQTIGQLKAQAPGAPIDLKQQAADASQSWLNTVSTANNNFTTTFNTLPQKGNEAGTNMGTSASSTLQGAAGGIGSIIGNSAAAAIKAAVSNLNINVNANVTGANNANADKGGTKAD